ncbi:MAG: rod shape-determining protein MreD [Proteobacteria bacterium ST_bin11]|jgi:rod shape-determining protein MreD|nr:MAG: rod shape-determining protein MreD [Proteobacteria bacterium ST_bin11]
MSRLDFAATAYFFLTVGAAMVLRVMSLFPSMDVFNPDWIVLVLIYWSIALPERFGVFSAWWIGLFTDVLTGRLLGQYALIYALICYLSINEHRRLRQFPMLQQCLFVFFSLFASQSIIFGMESMQTGNRLPVAFWYPVLSGTLVWPLVFVVLRYIRVMARIV